MSKFLMSQTTGDWTGLAAGTSLYKKARLKKLVCLLIKQNNLTYLGQVVHLVYPCLPGSTLKYKYTVHTVCCYTAKRYQFASKRGRRHTGQLVLFLPPSEVLLKS